MAQGEKGRGAGGQKEKNKGERGKVEGKREGGLTAVRQNFNKKEGIIPHGSTSPQLVAGKFILKET